MLSTVMMRAVALVLGVILLVTVHVNAQPAACVETQLCAIGLQWDHVLCQCVATPTTVGPTVAPTVGHGHGHGVAVVTLSFNVTVRSSTKSDSAVRKLIVAGMRQIAIGDFDTNQGAGLPPADVLISKHDVHRLTPYSTTDNTTLTSTWSFKMGFTGAVMPDDPTMGATGESTAFLIQAFKEAAQFQLTLKLLASTTQPTTTTTPTQGAFQIHDTAAITQAQGIMTTQTCDDGTDMAATATCPVTSSSSIRVGVMIGSIVGGVVLLSLVIGAVMVVRRRRAASAKAMDKTQQQQQQPQELTTQV